MQIVARNHLMKVSGRLGSVPLFVAGRTWTVDDAVAFAAIRDELGAEVEETLALAHAEDRAEAEERAIDEEELQSRSESFRHEHGLISAGETEDWLKERGLTTEDFGRWLYQKLCREAGAIDPPAAGWPIPPDFADLLRIHLWLSGAMERIAEQLRRRAAAALELAPSGEVTAATEEWIRHRGLDRDPLLAWLAAWGRDARWLEELARIEGAFALFVEQGLTPAARARKLAAMARSLAVVEFDLLDLDSPEVAREAALCVHDDGLPLAEVGREAGFRVVRNEQSLEELGLLGERLFAAGEGEIVGPVQSGGRHRLYQVLHKRIPSLSDETVVRRIDALILDEIFTDLTARHLEPVPMGRSL